MKNKLFTILLAVMFIVGIMVFIMPQKETSTFERRTLHNNSGIDVTDLANTSNEVLNDQFPLRNESISFLNILRNLFNTPFNRRLLKEKDDLIHFDNDYFINEYYVLKESDKLTALNKAYNIQQLSEKYPDVKVYVYFPTRIEETSLLDSDDVKSVFPQLKEVFLVQLGDRVKVSSMSLNTIDDYYKYYNKTDLHWNGYGVYEGYKDVINMVGEDFDIGSPKEANFTTYPFDFYGNYATKLGFICVPDNLIDVEIETGSYKYYVNGKESDDTKELNTYKEVGNEDSLYSDYEFVYGDNAFERIYDFNQPDKPNLLVFSDSYFNAPKRAVASHFNKTVIIDLRANDGTFNIDEYIKKYNINTVLFLQRFEDLYFNGYFFIDLE